MKNCQIIFTESLHPVSFLIKEVTKEPVSHVAVRINNLILHSTGHGVKIEHINDFFRKNKQVFDIDIAISDDKILDSMQNNIGKKYDFLGFLMLGLRLLFPKWIEKQDIRGISGSLICTELVTSMFLGREILITPYQLYLKLKKEGNKE